MRAAGVKKEARGTFLRKVGRPKPVLYEVTDKNPTKKEWNRVVAVFVTGQAWQFKEWPNEVRTISINEIRFQFLALASFTSSDFGRSTRKHLIAVSTKT